MLKHLIFVFFLIPFVSNGQTDILVLKKRGAHVRTYTVGSEIMMKTIYDQWFSGTITRMWHDTVSVNGLGFSYKEIAAIRRNTANFGNTTVSAGMIGSGIGIFVLGAVNGGLVRHDKSKDWYTTSGLITGSALLVVGYLLTKTRSKTYRIGHRYKLDYLQLTFDKKKGTSVQSPTQ